MNYKIYSIYDVKTQIYATPFFDYNDESAKRGFYCSMAKCLYPQDMVLYCVGSINNKDGNIIPCFEKVTDFILDEFLTLVPQKESNNG